MPITKRRGTTLDDMKQHPYVITCEESGCYLSLASPTELQAHDLLSNHTCPYPQAGPLLNPESKSLIMQMWDELDAVFNQLKVNPTTDLQNYGRGVAFCISVLCTGLFHTVDEVKIEANARWEMRQGIREERPTPGYARFASAQSPYPSTLDQRKAMGATVQPTPGNLRTGPPTPSARPRQTTPRAGYRIFEQSDIQRIREINASGLFTAAQLATTYDCPESQIKEICA